MKHRFSTLFLLPLIISISSCKSTKINYKNQNICFKDTIYLYISELTLEEKIGQLFVIRPDSLENIYTDEEISVSREQGITTCNETAKEKLKKYNPGGVIIFGKNIESPEQLKTFTSQLQNNAPIPLFICTDEEGGTVTRIASKENFYLPKYESMEAVGNTKNTNEAFNVGKTIGSYLYEFGINVDFAPVADVNTNPENRVIGNRSFGNNPYEVADMIEACIYGFHSQNVMTCIKHFPGHGDTKKDTHADYVAIKKNWNQLKKCELIPFERGIAAETDMIMTAHITANKITKDKLPSTLSYKMITKKLREELGYNGVIITDAMDMGAIHKNFTEEESTVLAIKAGVDLILMPYNFEKCYFALYDAVKNNEISERQINESLHRILLLKEKYGLIKF